MLSLLGVILAVLLFVVREVITLHRGVADLRVEVRTAVADLRVELGTAVADLRVEVVDRLDLHVQRHHPTEA